MNQLRLYLLFAVAMLLFACKGPKETTGGTDGRVPTPQPEKPSWVSERPISQAYYVGIGSASKLREPNDYQSVAKKNALNDLSSEIRVVIEGESFLNTIDRNHQFEEEFRSQIKTRTIEDIQDFEIMDSWETAGEYWVYYRLSKATHERIKKEKKDKALNASFDLYSKGKQAVSEGNFSSGFDMHLRALLELKDYWTEVNPYLVEGQTLYLDNAIYNDLRKLGSELTLVPESREVVLNTDNSFQASFKVKVLHQGTGVRGIPVSYHYDKGKFARPKVLLTDAEGEILVPVEDVNLDAASLTLSLIIDPASIPGDDLDEKLVEPLISGIKADALQLPILVMYPKVFIQSSERMFGQNGDARRLANALSAKLSARGFRITAVQSDADYVIRIDSDTMEGGTSQGFHVAYLDMSLSVAETGSGDEVFKRALSKVKGLQLNYGAAGLEAYKKGIKSIEDELSRELIEQIL